MKRAKGIIEKIIYITIATVDEHGQPWNTPVYSAYDEDYNFYWASWTGSQHSKNIDGNNKIFIVIYDSTALEGSGEGVYIKAKAYKLDDRDEIKQALKLLYERKNKQPRPTNEFLGTYPRRVYKAVPEQFWVNIDSDRSGNFIDDRKEIKVV